MKIVQGLPKKSAVGLLIASGLLLAAAPARAQVASIFNGSYFALGGGIVGLEDAEIDYGGALSGGNIQFDAGWAVSGAAGWRGDVGSGFATSMARTPRVARGAALGRVSSNGASAWPPTPPI